MNIKKKIIISLITICTVFKTDIFAQSPSDRQNFLPKIIPSSPEAAMLQRFGNYNVNLFNGVPEISIPLYEINTGKLKVPITLSYHASGIRVRDEATFVGLGWNLFAGGAISRTVKSKADEQLGYLNGSYTIASPGSLDPLNNGTDLNYSNDATRGLYDLEPDIYSCNLPTINCKFYYGNRSITQPVIIPFSSAKINTALSGNALSFSILDESGIEYKLGNTKEMYSSGTSLDFYPTAWNVEQMISEDKTDIIYFNYSDNSYNGGGGDYYDLTTVTDKITNTTPGSCGSQGNSTIGGGTISSSGGGQASGIGSNVLQEIKFPQGKVVFELDAVNRLDIPNKSLKTVKIYSLDPVTQNYTLLKTYTFSYSYFVNGTERRLKLTSLQLKDNVNVNIQTYSFTYNETNTMPLKNSRSRDFWGYFNNKTNNTLIPYTDILLLGNGGVGSTPATIGGPLNGREPDPAFNQVGTLTKITYPTGGTSEFTYETNQYYDNVSSTTKYSGGLRIKQIKSTDPVTSISNYKTYKYGVGENGFGNIIIPINLSYFLTEQNYYYSFNIYDVTRRIRNYSSNPNIGLEPFDGSAVGYNSVTEYHGTEIVNTGKSIYQYSFVPDNYGYDLVEFNRPSIGSRHFERGQLISKTNYKKNPDGSFKMLQSVNNAYGAWPNTFSTDAVNLRLFEATTFQYQQNLLGSCQGTPFQYQPYVYGSYRITNGDNRLISSVQKNYDEADELKFITKTTTYSYGNYAHKQVTKITSANTKNETVETIFRYPHEVAAQTVPPLTTIQQTLLANMITANMLNKVIEKEERLNSTLMTLVHTEYAAFGANHYYPAYINTTLKTNPSEREVTFNSYDGQGNITKYTGRDGVEASFIWDYNLRYPVAKIAGASSADCAYSSFEADGTGNWTFTGKPALEQNPPTGKKVYNPSLGQLTKTVITAGVYTVSYWSKNGQRTVNGTTAVVGRIANGWTYYEHKVTLAANGTVTVSGSGVIDELRLYPASALMSTYTYDNLVGITSQCDHNNRISYYEYDGSQRLSLVRDQDRKILKKICYNYAGEPENCNIYYNDQQAGIYTKSCGAGYFGNAVTYIVPANTYSAATLPDANSLAMLDVQANGQNYANTTGVCTAGITVNGYNAKTGFNYNVKFTPTGGGTSYTFSLPQGSQFVALGVVPSGNYSVQFFPAGSSTTATFVVNGLTFFGSGGTTFTNVNVTSTSSAYMY